MNKVFSAIEGGCNCGHARYRLIDRPMVVHCCHCHWCQRETGSGFAINALIESDRLRLLEGTTRAVVTPSESGASQTIVRCSRCMVAVWSHYAAAREKVSFLRVGTLDDPDRCPPDIHIFVASKQDWVVLPQNVPAVPEYYERSEYWSAESVARYRAVSGR